MKKFFKSIVLCLAAFAALGCVKEEALVFDHEQAAFATQDGQILIEAIQLVMGRPLSMRAQTVVSYVGLAFFLFIFVVALRNDIVRFVLGR